MPFTIGGKWAPEKPTKDNSSKAPKLKIVREKRKNSFVTLIQNLSVTEDQLKKICSDLKQKLGCGGTVRDKVIELQGDQVTHIKLYLEKISP